VPTHRRSIPHCRDLLGRMRGAAPRALAASAALLACATLVACGSSSPSSAASAASSEAQDEAKLAAFARCLREHGLQAETSAGPNGGGLKLRPGRASSSPQAFEAAQQACARYRPTPKRVDLSPQQKVEREEAVQKFARCMREHGIKVETSTTGGAIRIGIHHRAGEAGPNPESPGFQAAQNACQKLLPFKGPGPGGAEKSTGGGHEGGPPAGRQGTGLSLSSAN
jgi:hypothetical protein